MEIYVRSSDENRRLVKEALARLPKCDSIEPEYEIVEQWAAAGRAELLLEFAGALRGHASRRSAGKWQFGALLDHIGWVLPLAAGLAQAEASLAFARLAETASSSLSRMVASRLASAQPADVLESLFERYASKEEQVEHLACLLHEMVIREVPCPAMPAVAAFAEELRRRDHPLSWLPLVKADIETEIYLPVYHNRSSGAAIPFGPNASSERNAPVSGREPAEVCETTTSLDEDRISVCAAGWQAESNGRLEARTFAVSTVVGPKDVSPAFVERLELDSAEGKAASVRPVSASAAFAILFSAASDGGAYGGGHYGAYGRLYAWRSLAGLTGAPADATWEHVQDLAQRSFWFRFDADDVEGGSSWFCQVAWDFGLIVVRPDGRSLAVLAATDED